MTKWENTWDVHMRELLESSSIPNAQQSQSLQGDALWLAWKWLQDRVIPLLSNWEHLLLCTRAEGSLFSKWTSQEMFVFQVSCSSWLTFVVIFMIFPDKNSHGLASSSTDFLNRKTKLLLHRQWGVWISWKNLYFMALRYLRITHWY